MDFHVELSDLAQRDIAAIYDWLRSQQAGDVGERWFVALREAIASLTNLPSRCPLAPENRDSPVEVRQLEADRHSARERSLLLRVGELLVEHRVGITRGLSSGLEVLPPAVKVALDDLKRPARKGPSGW